MKLTKFEDGGKQSYSAVVGEGIFDLGDRAADLRALLATDALDGPSGRTKGDIARKSAFGLDTREAAMRKAHRR
jgi:hypothetical protein